MGTDIHGVFQRHNTETNTWEDIPSNYEQGRHYQLFAVLAGVRNGTGFGGVKTGDAVTPIAKPRGFPDGFEVDEDDAHPLATLDHMDPRRREWHGEDEELEVWMGDHSFSWLSGEEMLSWYANAPTVTHVGIIGRKAYEAWDGGCPNGYCGGIGGPGVIVVNDTDEERAATPGWTHIRVQWKTCLRDELSYFFNEVARLQAEHGSVRFVFGFDS